jgi:hypothetical protein
MRSLWLVHTMDICKTHPRGKAGGAPAAKEDRLARTTDRGRSIDGGQAAADRGFPSRAPGWALGLLVSCDLCAGQAGLLDALDRLATGGDAELAVDRHRLALDRVLGEAEPLADLPEGQVGRQQRQEP